MSKDTTKVTENITMTGAEVSDLLQLNATMEASLASLQDEKDSLQEELDVTRQGDALGIAWTDVFGAVLADDGSWHIMKVSLTSRSYVSPKQALTGLLKAVKSAEEYNLRPYAVQPRTATRSAPTPRTNEHQPQQSAEIDNELP